MQSLIRIINWYISPFSKLNRLHFNIIFALAFLPVIWLQVQNIKSTVQAVDNDAISSVQSILNNTQTMLQTDDLEQILKKSDETRTAAEGLMKTFNINAGGKFVDTQNSSNVKLIELFIYLSLIPTIHMRLRDIGLWDSVHLAIYTTFICAKPIQEAIGYFFRIDIALPVSLACSTLSGIMLFWLCTRPSLKKEDKLTSNHMPGDSPDDPY